VSAMALELVAEYGEQEIGSGCVLGIVVGKDDVLYAHIYAIEKDRDSSG